MLSESLAIDICDSHIIVLLSLSPLDKIIVVNAFLRYSVVQICYQAQGMAFFNQISIH